jgi:hypothetical protein
VNDPDAARRRAIVNPGGKSAQALKRSAGLAAPLDPSRHYRVEPGYGEAGPEYFPRSDRDRFGGVEAARARALWLSDAHAAQRVVRQDGRVVARFTNGRELHAVPETGD